MDSKGSGGTEMKKRKEMKKEKHGSGRAGKEMRKETKEKGRERIEGAETWRKGK